MRFSSKCQKSSYTSRVRSSPTREPLNVSRSGRDSRCDLDSRLVLVVGQLVTLGYRVEDIGHGYRLPVVPLGAHVAGVVEGDLAHRLHTRPYLDPGSGRGIPHGSILRHLQSCARAGCLHVEAGSHRHRDPGEGIVPYWWVVDVEPNIDAVDGTDPSDGAPGGSLGPHPQVTDCQLLLSRDICLTQRPRAPHAGHRIASHPGQV